MNHRIILYLMVFFLLADIVSAQGLRRLPGRPPAPEPRSAPQPAPTPRQGPPIGPREPLYQGDGRLMERVLNLVNVATSGGTQFKSVAFFAVASFDDLKRMAQTVTEKVRLNKEITEEPVFLNALLDALEQMGDQGFDTKQPLGCMLQTDGIILYPFVFVPLDLESQAGRSILNRIGQRLPDGRYVVRQDVVRWPFGNLFIRPHNGWMFIATEMQLGALPPDPRTLFRGTDKENLFTARLDLYNMPLLATNTALSLGETHAVAQAVTELERASTRLWFGYLRSLTELADFLELTLTYDEQANEFILKQRESVRPNLERHDLLRQRRDMVSPFHGFYHPEKAIFASHIAMPLTKPLQDNLETILDETFGKSVLSEEERGKLKPADQPQGLMRRNRPNEQPESSPVVVSPPLLVPPTPPTPPPPPDALDASTRLAELLAMGASETSEEPDDNLTDAQKIEDIVRRVVTCYYRALLGAVRSGYFDGAITLSMSDGFMGAYRIVDDGAFRQAFDELMETLAEKYPGIYAEQVRKDYAELQGFRLTDVVLRLDDLFPDAWWMQYVPQGVRQQPGVRIVFGARRDAVCFAVGLAEMPEQRLRKALAETTTPQRTDDLFFNFSAYQLGRAIAESDKQGPLPEIRAVFANSDPTTKAYFVSGFSDTSKTITYRINALMIPSLWQVRENIRNAVWFQ